MEHQHEVDLVRVKELLNRTGEFIAYFELAESKMISWRQEIEMQATHIQHQSGLLIQELYSIQSQLSEIGVADFRATAEKALTQGKLNLDCLERSCLQFTDHLQTNQEQIRTLTNDSIEKIDKHINQTTHNIATQLAKYDAQHFKRIAIESCDHVEQVANNAIAKSNKLIHLLKLRLGLFSVILTLFTAFIIALYMNDESPWEIHNQAMNERQAGKMLLKAWPNLSQLEKEKILGHSGHG